VKIALFTLFALLAFAGNSVLCRLALGEQQIDAASFTVVRLLSAMFVLAILQQFKYSKTDPISRGSWSASVMLFLYAIFFSFAYVSLDTGVGALILFGAVQITMILTTLVVNKKLVLNEWLGLTIAISGLIYLLAPGLSTPDILDGIFMALAGIAWGAYTLIGKKSLNPLADTAYNFYRTLPMVLLAILFFMGQFSYSVKGVMLAFLSGSLTSGIGYALWYAALPKLSNIQAASLQLLVPLLAALGGVWLSHEHLSLHLLISAFLILGGVVFVLFGKKLLSAFLN
jgi:drug/metabolite transporter (DMT)-like permease